ncbi:MULTISPECIES: FUSC family protein [Sphingobacterium]|uniref:FUSC family protein n=1 Tax=Sphingobacterium TaxID=28453 RepID=UPI0010457A65|nr:MULTISPECIES: FUSC family membrane protein [Sphingobacterium]MCW2263083.1 putative membrane protein YccC [Sphingobacterium kitahiroshimense]TCR11933.1 putative membrane protein YccC [Sphingobacterium sp. JUb78]
MIKIALRNSAGLLNEFGPEALRACLSAMIPAFLIGYYYHLDYSVPFLIAAMNASMTDFPGRQKDKLLVARSGIFWTMTIALTVGVLLPYPIFLIVAVSAAAAIFTMFTALGKRIGMVGVTNLFMITFTMGLHPHDPLQFALFAGAGTAFYHLVSIIHSRLFPLWELKRALNICYLTSAQLLRVKAKYYVKDDPLNQIYKEAAQISIRLAEQHELIRYLLLQNKNTFQNETAYPLWIHAYQLIDLYSLATSVNRDYQEIRMELDQIGASKKVKALILAVADCVETTMHNQKNNSKDSYYIQQISRGIEDLEQINFRHNKSANEALIDVIENSTAFIQSRRLLEEGNEDHLVKAFYDRQIDYDSFITPVKSSIKDIWYHIHSYTPLSMFALRMAFLFLVGGIFGYILSEMKYTYWIFMTIIVVTRPTFSATVVRNIDRLTGTMIGLILGSLIVNLTTDIYYSILFAGILMFCFLIFNRRYYDISVAFITASVVVALNLTEHNIINISTNRLLFTCLGCGLSVLCWYLIPIRAGQKIDIIIKNVLQENNKFKEAVMDFLHLPNDQSHLNMRVARKKAFMSLTALSDSCFLTQKEPGLAKGYRKKIMNLHAHSYHYHELISSFLIENKADKNKSRCNTKSNERRFQKIKQLNGRISKDIANLNFKPTNESVTRNVSGGE